MAHRSPALVFQGLSGDFLVVGAFGLGDPAKFVFFLSGAWRNGQGSRKEAQSVQRVELFGASVSSGAR